MGKVAEVGKKKKGRPSLADLRRRCHPPPPSTESDRRLRRHRQHRSEEKTEEEEEEEGEEKREKKLKLVLRLPVSYQNQNQSHNPNQNQKQVISSKVGSVDRGQVVGGARFSQRVLRDVTVAHPSAAPPDSSSSAAAAVAAASPVSSFEEYDDVHKPLKKRKLDNDGDDDDDDDDVDDDCDVDNAGLRPNGSAMADLHKKEKKSAVSKPIDPAPGTPPDSAAAMPLPDTKLLEFLLDKLQKKDTYGVYAGPVDPNELPDYHDVIEHPMDFGTIRKKLAGGVYTTLEEFEKEVFLICKNAMRYNAPDTIYFKQARSIRELARKKFEKLRVDGEGIEMEFKSAQKGRSNSLPKKPIKRSSGRSTQEPVGSDFSSGATLAMAGDTGTLSNAAQANTFEEPGNMISFGDGSSFMTEIGSEKAEELSAKGLTSKLGRKPFVLDENRRLTYKISSQFVGGCESLFSIIEGESKQLISVGLHAEHAYARSLARFAAALGPVAWKVASQRIKQSLSADLEFGRGWVGEYEPLPRLIVSSQEQVQGEAAHGAATRLVVESKRDTKETREELQGKQNCGPSKATASRALGTPLEGSVSGTTSDEKPDFLRTRTVACSLHQQQHKNNLLPINAVNSDINDLRGSKFSSQIGSSVASQASSSCSVSTSSMPVDIALRRREYCSEVPTSRLLEMVSRNSSSISNSDGIRSSNSASEYISNYQDRVGACLARGNHDQVGPNNPARSMRMLSGKVIPTQPQPKALNQSTVDKSMGRDAPCATTAAARQWMSMRSGELALTENFGLHRMQMAASSIYNPSRELSKEASGSAGVLQSEKNRLNSRILPHPVHVSGELQFQNQSMVFPQLVRPDLSRFQVQSPWQGLVPQSQQRQKTDTAPPDLNIGFQLPGSPVRQSSGKLVDSQQPDLALQL